MGNGRQNPPVDGRPALRKARVNHIQLRKAQQPRARIVMDWHVQAAAVVDQVSVA